MPKQGDAACAVDSIHELLAGAQQANPALGRRLAQEAEVRLGTAGFVDMGTIIEVLDTTVRAMKRGGLGHVVDRVLLAGGHQACPTSYMTGVRLKSVRPDWKD